MFTGPEGGLLNGNALRDRSYPHQDGPEPPHDVPDPAYVCLECLGLGGVSSLAPRYEKVLQEVYKPVGASRDFTTTCAFPFGPASEFKLRLIETVSRQRGGLN